MFGKKMAVFLMLGSLFLSVLALFLLRNNSMVDFKQNGDKNNSSSKTIVSDEKTAKQLSDAFVSQTLKKNPGKYKQIYVCYNSDAKLWEITYAIDKETIGDDITIIVSEKTGEIVRVLYGE